MYTLTPHQHAHVTPIFERGRDVRDTLKMVASALAEDRITVCFQPVVSAQNFGFPAFEEALVRIVDRSGELVPAAKFMPQVEGSDICKLVDRAVLRKVIDILATTQKVRISVNISANNIGDQGWLKILQDACDANPIIGDFLIVEITEGSTLEFSPENVNFLNTLRKLGCSIAVDDFGAGKTTIAQLGKFRFDFLKIDGSFIQDLENNTDNQVMVKSMLTIAQKYDMVTVAEMVETQAAVDMLKTMGVDCLQGYYIGRPAASPEWLQSTASY